MQPGESKIKQPDIFNHEMTRINLLRENPDQKSKSVYTRLEEYEGAPIIAKVCVRINNGRYVQVHLGANVQTQHLSDGAQNVSRSGCVGV